MKKKLSLILVVALFVSIVPINIAYADDITSDGTLDLNDYADGSGITIHDNVNVTIIDSNPRVRNITISSGSNTRIVLRDINTQTTNGSPVYVAGVNAEIVIQGNVQLSSNTNDYPGITIDGDNDARFSASSITGSGTLTVSGGNGAAGIGSSGGRYGDITIDGPTIIATGGYNGAGIGTGSASSQDVDLGSITINSGTILAQGGQNAAGIGGGNNTKAGNITISGGYVEAYSLEGSGGAGIGSGAGSNDAGSINILGGDVFAKGSSTASDIGSGNTTSGSGYGTLTIAGSANVFVDNGSVTSIVTMSDDHKYSTINAPKPNEYNSVSIPASFAAPFYVYEYVLPPNAMDGQIVTISAPEFTGDGIQVLTVDDKDSTPMGDGTVLAENDSMTPMLYYDIKVPVAELDTIADIKQLNVKLWCDTTGSTVPMESEFTDMATTLGSDTTEIFEITWNGDAPTEVTTDSYGTLWEVYDSVLPDSNDRQGTSFTYIFRVKVSKVAKEATTTPRWWCGSTVIDYSDKSAYDTSTKMQMNWYGETIVPESHMVFWGGVPANTDYADSHAKVRVFSGVDDEDITYICNGDYLNGIKSSAAWPRSAGTYTAITQILRSDATAVDNSFVLRFGLDDTNDGAYVEGNTGVLPANEDNYYDFATDGVATDESGVSRSDYYMYIATGAVFPTGDTYDGSITFNIANR